MKTLEDDKIFPETLNAFFQQFGELQEQDKIVLDYIFELIYNSKGTNDLSVSGEAKQEKH